MNKYLGLFQLEMGMTDEMLQIFETPISIEVKMTVPLFEEKWII